jgi:hypothetical protein
MSDLPENWETLKKQHITYDEGRKIIDLSGRDLTYFSIGPGPASSKSTIPPLP